MFDHKHEVILRMRPGPDLNHAKRSVPAERDRVADTQLGRVEA